MIDKYRDFDKKNVNLKEVENQISKKLIELVKYYEKNALGIKDENRKQFKEKLEDMFE